MHKIEMYDLRMPDSPSSLLKIIFMELLKLKGFSHYRKLMGYLMTRRVIMSYIKEETVRTKFRKKYH